MKIGDKVKCVRANDSQFINRGEIYTIKKILGLDYFILEEIDFDHNYFKNRFEPFDEDHFNDELFTL